jgi:hypothetical protein
MADEGAEELARLAKELAKELAPFRATLAGLISEIESMQERRPIIEGDLDNVRQMSLMGMSGTFLSLTCPLQTSPPPM